LRAQVNLTKAFVETLMNTLDAFKESGALAAAGGGAAGLRRARRASGGRLARPASW